MPLKARVQSITGERATLMFEDGQTLSVSFSAVDSFMKEGVDVAVVITSLGAEDAGRAALARELLNELLRP